MALVQISPLQARIRWDRRLRRPADVRVAGRHLRVTALDGVRDETAAFPAGRGPRVTYRLETDAGPATLVYDGWQRRWYVEALDQAA